VNQAIVPTCPGSLNTTQGTANSTGVSATDPDGKVVSATITSAPVAGITLNSFTPASVVGGTATATLSVANTTAVGTYNVTIQYSNNDSPTPQTATCTVTVKVAAPNQPISANCPGSLSANQGTAKSVGVSATDPDGTVTSASITSAPVAGITLDSFVPAANGGTATATLNVAATTVAGNYNVTIGYANNDSPSPQTAACTVAVSVQSPPPTTVKISQVYGGGGNSGSTYTNDFIEIYNQGPTTIDLTSWSVQYASATATTWSVTNLCAAAPCTLAPGHYYLVQESQGTSGTTALPTPDASGTIAMSGTQAKVALVASTAPLSGACPTGGSIVDFVGYGSANCSESTPTPALTATTAAVRRGNGCVDTDNNANDFVIIGPIPRNSASPVNSCGGDATQPSGLGIATPGSLDPASNTLLTVNVTPASAPPSTNITVNADLTSIGGAASQQFYDDGTHGDVTVGDNTFSFEATVAPTTTTGVKNIVATITDADARIATAPITLTVQSPTCGVERWSVKVGTDPDVSQVNLDNPVPTTIAELGALTPPANPPGPPDNARIAPTEATVYVVNATMTLFKKETDVDYHIVLQDDTGHTMIAEIPSPACILSPTSPRALVTSPLGAGIANSREKFDARFTATPNFQPVSVPVRVKGVAFFDFIHGQTGVAPNGIELHPVLDIDFTANTTTTLMSSANPSQYGQQVAITATVSNGGGSTPTGNVSFFDGGSPLDVVALDPSGQATFRTSTLSVGSHSITASYEGDTTSAPSTSSALAQVVNKADQTITFPAIAPFTWVGGSATLNATASSGLAVTYSVISGPCSVTGNTLTATDAGSCVVAADQAGDANYSAAPQATASATVNKADQAITFAALADKTYGDAPFTVSATGGASGNAVTFSASGNCASGGTNGSTITINGAGSCTVTASQAGDANYNAAADVAQTFTVKQATASITVNGYTGVYDGGAHGATGSATGVGGEDLSGLLNLGACFTNVPGGTANWSFAGDANYKPASGTADIVINKATPLVPWNNPADIIYGTALGDGQLNATASVPGVFVYNPAAGTILNAGNGQTLSVGFTPADTTNYNNASANASLNVLKATPTVSAVGGTFTYDGAAHAANGSVVGVGSPGENLGTPNFTYNGEAAAPVNAGTYNVAASFAGNSNYNPASNTATITINKATPVVNWNTPADIIYGTPLSSTQLNASANVPGTFTYTPAQNAVLFAGSAQPLLAAFTPADATNYASTTKIVTINVLKATPAFSNLSSPVIGCGTSTVNLSGRITFGSLVPTGGVNITLNGVTRSAAIQPDGSFSAAFATGSLTFANSPLGITFSYGGDANFNPVGGAGTLSVVDSVPPTITLNGNMISLWPNNKQFHTISVGDLVAGASDGCDASVNLSSVVISQVTSDEGASADGDIIIAADCRSVRLRAERNGNGDGRVYTITFRVRDASGNTTTKTAKVIVPHDQGHGNTAVDSGPAYTVAGGCS
jgi:hypothetical protein